MKKLPFLSLALAIGSLVLFTSESAAVVLIQGDTVSPNQTNEAVQLDTPAGTFTIPNGITITDNAANGVGSSGAIATGWIVNNSGTVSSVNNDAINMDKGGTVTNNAAGTITGNINGVQITGAVGTVTNSGSITGGATGGDFGVHAAFAGSTVTNKAGASITGDIGVEVNDGAIFNAGTINCSGTTAAIILRGTSTVTLQTGSNLIGNVDEPAGGTSTLILEGTGSEEAVFKNLDILNMNGSGTWILTGDSTTTNASFSEINVNTGTLLINSAGSIGTGGGAATVVAAGATLGGSGTINSPITVDGTFAPGASIGTTTVSSGDVTFASESTFEVEFNNTTNDLLSITGTGGNAILNADATVIFIPLDVPIGPIAQTVVIDGVDPIDVSSGDFGTKTFPVLLTGTAQVNPNNNKQYVFEITKVDAIASVAQTTPQKQISAGLDAVKSSATGALKDALIAIYSQKTVAGINNILNQLSPEPFAGLYPASLADAHNFMNLMQRRMSHLRSFYGYLSDQVPLLADSNPHHHTIANALHKTCLVTPHRNFWRGYTQGNAHYEDLDSDCGFTGYEAVGGGLLAGIDRYFTEDVVFGFSLGSSHTSINWDRSGTRADFETMHIGSYLGVVWDRIYWDNSLAYGLKYFDTERNINAGGVTGHATSHHFGHEVAASSHAGYAFPVKDVSFILTGGLDFVFLYDNCFSEIGAGTLGVSFDSNNTESLKTNLGFKLAYIKACSSFCPMLF